MKKIFTYFIFFLFLKIANGQSNITVVEDSLKYKFDSVFGSNIKKVIMKDNLGNTYISGLFYGIRYIGNDTIGLYNNQYHLFVAKFDNNLNYLWTTWSYNASSPEFYIDSSNEIILKVGGGGEMHTTNSDTLYQYGGCKIDFFSIINTIEKLYKGLF